MKHPRFGNTTVPYAEPSWYRGHATPYYQEKHANWRAKVREFVDSEIRPFAHKWDEQHSFPYQELRKKAFKAGVLAPWAPEHLGGTPPEGGWDDMMNLIWIDEITRGGAGGVQICLFFIAVMSLPHTLRYGSPQLIDRVAKPVLHGEAGICITLTEPWGGSDLASLRTTAVKSPDGTHYVVNGAKKFITGGTMANFFSTLVRTGGDGPGGVSLLIVEADLPGVSVRKLEAQGWWSGNTTMVTFDNVKVQAGNLIGKEGMGFRYMVDVMNGERFIAVIAAIRSARMCLESAIEFARERVTFGKRLIDHQVIRHKLMNMARKVDAAQAYAESLAYDMSQGVRPQDVGGPMALAKVQATQALEFCSREASQVLGGASYLRQGKGELVERLSREVRVQVVGGGSEEIMLDLAGRQAKL